MPRRAIPLGRHSGGPGQASALELVAADERKIATEHAGDIVRLSAGAMVDDEAVGKRDVGPYALIAGLSVHPDEREARVPFLIRVERRPLDESMNTLFSIDVSDPRRVHPAQGLCESLGVYSVRRFNHDVRHLVILPKVAQGVIAEDWPFGER
jgi:hypothetical protein